MKSLKSIVVQTTGEKTPQKWSRVLRQTVNPPEKGIDVKSIVYLIDGSIRLLCRERKQGAASALINDIKEKTTLAAKDTTPTSRVRVTRTEKGINKETVESAIREQMRLSPEDTVIA